MKPFTFELMTLLLILGCEQPLEEEIVEEDSIQTFMKIYGGSEYDLGRHVQQTTDEGYIIIGRTHSFGSGAGDVWLVKTDSLGEAVWSKTFGGINHDRGRYVQQTSDDGYILAGRTDSYGGGGADAWLIKTNSTGDIEWSKTFGDEGFERIASARETTDGGYILTGHDSVGADLGHVSLIKTDAVGEVGWTNAFGGGATEYGAFVQQTSDGGYILVGRTNSLGEGNLDVYLIKTNSQGDSVWTKTYGGSQDDYGYAVQQIEDGGYIIVGNTRSQGAGDRDIWLLKTSSSGELEWSQTFGGDDQEWGFAALQTADGGYIITGQTHSYGAGDGDVWLIKTNSSGDSVWTKTFGGSDGDWGYSVQQTLDRGYIIAGVTNFDGASANLWLIKTDEDGNVD